MQQVAFLKIVNLYFTISMVVTIIKTNLKLFSDTGKSFSELNT